MINLTQSEKNWLVVLLMFVLGAVSYFGFAWLNDLQTPDEPERSFSQPQRLPEKPNTPLGQQER